MLDIYDACEDRRADNAIGKAASYGRSPKAAGKHWGYLAMRGAEGVKYKGYNGNPNSLETLFICHVHGALIAADVVVALMTVLCGCAGKASCLVSLPCALE